MDTLKAWLVQIGIKRLGPSAIRGAILGLSGWLMAKGGMLESFGIISDAAAHTTTIYWDKMNDGLILLLPAIMAAVIKLMNHHVVATVTHTSQTGASKIEPEDKKENS